MTQGYTPAKKICWITRKYPPVGYSKFTGSPESTHRRATQNLQDHQKVPTGGLLKIYTIIRKYPPMGYSKFTGSQKSTHWWATPNLQDHLKVPTSGLLKIYRIPRKYPPVGYSKFTGSPESTHQWATQKRHFWFHISDIAMTLKIGSWANLCILSVSTLNLGQGHPWKML